MRIRLGFMYGLWLLLASTSAHAATCSSITDSLAAHWALDSATTTTADTSGNANTATLAGSPAIVAGKISNGMSFATATSDRLTAVSSASLNLGTGDFTISLWFFPDDDAAAYVLVYKGKPSTASEVGWDLLYRGDLANDPVNLRVNNTGSGTAATIGFNSPAPLSGAWHHLVVACDRDIKCDVYLDGVDLGDDTDITGKAATLDSAGVFCFGGSTSGAGGTCASGLYNGDLDQVRINKCYMTASQAAELFAEGTAVITRRIFSVQ